MNKKQCKTRNKTIGQIYSRAIQKTQNNKLITCPDCGETILLIPTLSKMNQAIEKHVQNHKQVQNHQDPLRIAKPICIRLSLARQVLQKR